MREGLIKWVGGGKRRDRKNSRVGKEKEGGKGDGIKLSERGKRMERGWGE